MNIETLMHQFNRSIGWNAYLYFCSKILSTLLTLVLFKRLTVSDFSLWANINCCIFLILLWLDFGLRKSIPRFCPDFAQNTRRMKQFLGIIISFKLFMAMISLPILYLALTNIGVPTTSSINLIYILATSLFIIEALKNILMLIFQAHFWNKPFNILESIIQATETLAALSIAYISTESTTLMLSILAIKAIGGALTAIISLGLLIYRYSKIEQIHAEAINTKMIAMSFVKHSGIMWVNTTIKSLSERNFLQPLLTAILGPGQANIFKVANDGAMLFYRTVIKTIGTNDTALFSYVRDMRESERLTPIAFKKVTTKIAALCIPLLVILSIAGYISTLMFHDHNVFQLFFIITIGYLLEILVSGYERILEVNRRYWLLFYAYIPYMLVLCVLFTPYIVTCIGLVGMLGCIHGVRLVSSFIMVYFARRYYSLSFPLRSVVRLLLLTLCAIPLILIMGIASYHFFNSFNF